MEREYFRYRRKNVNGKRQKTNERADGKIPAYWSTASEGIDRTLLGWLSAFLRRSQKPRDRIGGEVEAAWTARLRGGRYLRTWKENL